MSNHKKNISFVIENNLSTLYSFALGMTTEQRHAEKLIQLFIINVFSHKDVLTEPDNIKTWLFKQLYHLCLENLDQQLDHYNKNEELILEEFFLYNRLEEIQIGDDDKLKLLYGIRQNDL
jgi:DNA-directed RNA polymerase specialized sigma24 family protein